MQNPIFKIARVNFSQLLYLQADIGDEEGDLKHNTQPEQPRHVLVSTVAPQLCWSPQLGQFSPTPPGWRKSWWLSPSFELSHSSQLCFSKGCLGLWRGWDHPPPLPPAQGCTWCGGDVPVPCGATGAVLDALIGVIVREGLTPAAEFSCAGHRPRGAQGQAVPVPPCCLCPQGRTESPHCRQGLWDHSLREL